MTLCVVWTVWFLDKSVGGSCPVPDGICDLKLRVRGSYGNAFQPGDWTHCPQHSLEWKACLARKGTLHPRRDSGRAQMPGVVQTQCLVGPPGSCARLLWCPSSAAAAPSSVPMRQPTWSPWELSHSVPFPDAPSPSAGR